MKRSKLLLPACLLVVFSLRAQLPEDLRTAIEQNTEDTTAVWNYIKASRYYHSSLLDSAVYFNQKALDLSGKLRFERGEAAALMRLTGIYRMAGQIEQAKKTEEAALKLATIPEVGEYAGKIYELKGNSMIDGMVLDSAYYYFSLAEKANLAIKQPYRNFSVYLGYSNIATQEEDDKKTEEYLLKAHEISSTRRIRKDHGMVLYFLMDFYFSRGDMKSYATYAAEYLELTQGDQSSLRVNPMHQFLYFFDEVEPVENQIGKMKQVIQAQSEMGHQRNLLISYDYLCLLQKEAGQWKEALQTAMLGLEAARRIQYLNEETAFTQIIAGIHEHLGDYRQAHQFLKKAQTLQDSVHVYESLKNRQELEVKFETEKKEAALALSQVQLEKEKEQQKMLVWILVLVAALALATLWFLYFKSKTNKILLEKNSLISQALKEKETLLREIHHRVKNNLQVVSSLLNLQSKSLSETEAKAAILEGQNRVKSMALIHQNLYQVDDLTTIDIKDYIEKLSQNLFNSYNIKKDHIRLETDIDQLQIDIDTLIPMGLILNEVLSNALKHAFPDNRSGNIEVAVKKEAADLILLVKDDGIGFNYEPYKGKSTSFGLMLIEDFARKLKAEMQFRNHHGSSFRLKIPDYQFAKQ